MIIRESNSSEGIGLASDDGNLERFQSVNLFFRRDLGGSIDRKRVNWANVVESDSSCGKNGHLVDPEAFRNLFWG